MDKILIIGVKPGSIAEDINLQKGDFLLSINGEKITDILDYKFYEADEELELEIKHSDDSIEIYEIEKDEGEPLGIEFASELIDKPHSCRNKCIFCFMEQLPPKVRDTLIFKDDDYRLSFFTGNYITMTNMNKSDIDRIIKYKISPINISVHATDENIRCKMLNNRFAGKVLKYLEQLSNAGISMNTQIVLCKDINDGKILEKTILDLSIYGKYMKSICIVPVGLSKYRNNLYPLKPLLKQDCINTINMVSNLQKTLKIKYNTRMVYLADEIYLKAGVEYPSYKEYEEFSQLENGVGMLALFDYEYSKELNKLKKKLATKNDIQKKEKFVTLVTGKITKEYIERKIDDLRTIFSNVHVNVVGIENEYFGSNITVTGLLSAGDIIKELKKIQNQDKNIKSKTSLGEYVVIPDVALKEDEDVFLDDVNLSIVQKQIGTKVLVAKTSAKGLVEAILKNDILDDITKTQALNGPINSYENSSAKY
ncbi:MAG: DUF512 domain-containing protein [Clostridia bacterium]